ncbi:quinone-dependent dihydroorotate dehydrogenase [Brevibacterium spongiae]|uniref:Dihydroorotate dehydrogenase (quinone) n=1 Tax=Brevibacterium spongiae TaxID=2909672 RepID=A0ABY5STB0_9MICO|nr:quinone-dependent dihydroorotate dehydrogenase [Brevibacterium spongiae]UVI37793.1 quinone-dependent dihydroorotate dehydrogenase [Brevibacterium spongiae]
MYSLIFRLLFAPMDAERAHHLSFTALRALDSVPLLGRVLRFICGRGTVRSADVLGLPFPNRVGLAAGFDKNGVGVRALSMLGFGHIEVGTITAHAQPGNDRPRLFRLRENLALLNRMGFNNDGSRQASFNIASERKKIDALPARLRPIVGINIGKTKIVEAADAVSDYAASTRVLAPLADYLVINVSSPNTPGLRDLQSVGSLEPIITAVRDTAAEVVENPRSTLGHVPLLVKIAPDLADDDVVEICDLALRSGVDGLITTNTTINRSVLEGREAAFAEAEAGGISGRPVADRSLEVLRLVKKHVGKELTVISVGGVADAKDARARVAAGADLVQVYSEMIYSGPFFPGRVIRGLESSRLLTRGTGGA